MKRVEMFMFYGKDAFKEADGLCDYAQYVLGIASNEIGITHDYDGDNVTVCIAIYTTLSNIIQLNKIENELENQPISC